VIVQRINLYQERFYDKRLWISARQLAALLVLAVAAASIWSFLLHIELNQTAQHGQTLRAERDTLTAELQTLNTELTQLLKDSRLDRDIETTARKIAARKQVLHFVDGNQFGSGRGFSDYLLALANLRVENVWLNRIRLGEGFVQLGGSALDASEIPTYFARFSNETVFQGDHFDLFQMLRDKDADWKVDFEIATREGSNE
jgi:signal transduction protein with GAF and PtsI domain